MLNITWRQMRSGWARLIAAGIAIMLGTAFVAASLLGGNVMQEATYQSFTRDYNGWDALITPTGENAQITPELIKQISANPAIAAVENKARFSAFIEDDHQSLWTLIGPADDSALQQLTEGSLPRVDDEIALSEHYAALLNLSIGDQLTLTMTDYDPNSGAEEHTELSYRISGLISAVSDFFANPSHGLVTQSEFNSPQLAFAISAGPLAFRAANPADLHGAIKALTAELGPGYEINTVTEYAEEMMEFITGETDTMRNILLGFATVALAVAILVISNTFSVLVAQRTTHLALLRTVGASRGQIRCSVLLEALALGIVASVAGLLLGFGIIAAAATWLADSLAGINLWAGMGITVQIWLTTILAGVSITLIASWAPAHAATKVRPLEALRPREPELGTTAGKFRAALAALTFLGGLALLLGGLAMRSVEGAGALALLLGISGGFISVLGILLGAVFVISPLVRVVGKLFGTSVPADVARMGAIRNPRRTATTTAALFIGVALVTMMSTGAATAKTTLTSTLAQTFYSDMQASALPGPDGHERPISPEQVEALREHEGLAAVTTLARTQIVLPSGQIRDVLAPLESFRGASVADPAQAFFNPSVYQDLATGEAAFPSFLAAANDLSIGGPMEGALPDGPPFSLGVGAIADSLPGILLTPETFTAIGGELAPLELLLELAPGADPTTMLNEVQELLTATTGANLQVTSGAVEREGYTSAIDMLLLIVNVLLGVAIIIALVGVANTLSLSVIERRRESATLRALGLTTGQLRASLAIEGSLIAALGAVVGVLGGMLYGWAGSYIILSGLADLTLQVPWGTILGVLVVAVVAGLAASVIPARSAVKVAPVAALAE